MVTGRGYLTIAGDLTPPRPPGLPFTGGFHVAIVLCPAHVPRRRVRDARGRRGPSAPAAAAETGSAGGRGAGPAPGLDDPGRADRERQLRSRHDPDRRGGGPLPRADVRGRA